MRKYLWILLLFLYSCDSENAPPCFKKSGDIQRELVWLPDYNDVQIEDYFEVYIYNSTKHKMEIEAGENIIGDVTYSISGDLLTLKSRERCSWVRDLSDKIKIHLYSPLFMRISVQHPAKLFTIDTLKQQNFSCYIQTSLAEVDITIKCQHFDYWNSFTNSGDIKISGVVDNAKLGNFGYAKLDARNLIAKNCTATATSTGSTHLFATDTLIINLDMDTKVFYYHQPKKLIINNSANGSATLTGF